MVGPPSAQLGSPCRLDPRQPGIGRLSTTVLPSPSVVRPMLSARCGSTSMARPAQPDPLISRPAPLTKLVCPAPLDQRHPPRQRSSTRPGAPCGCGLRVTRMAQRYLPHPARIACGRPSFTSGPLRRRGTPATRNTPPRADSERDVSTCPSGRRVCSTGTSGSDSGAPIPPNRRTRTGPPSRRPAAPSPGTPRSARRPCAGTAPTRPRLPRQRWRTRHPGASV